MFSTVGKDDKNQIWFKSDQFLTNITDAYFFYVAKTWFHKRYVLWARHLVAHRFYNDDTWKWETKNIEEDFKIGIYDTSASASVALEEVMRLKEIEPV